MERKRVQSGEELCLKLSWKTVHKRISLPIFFVLYILITRESFKLKRRLPMEIWMIIVGVSMSLGGFPQIYRMWKRKTSDDISLTLWIIMVHGVAWWLVYGITIGSISLIVTNIVCLILDSIILIMIIRYRTKSNQPIQPTVRSDCCYKADA